MTCQLWTATAMSDPLSASAEPLPLLPISSAATVRKCSRLTLRKHDVFVASFPKSGTTWMQHILHTLATDGQSPLAHVSDACPFFEIDRTWADEEAAVLSDAVRANHDKIGWRIFNTHLLWQMMPRDSSDARYVYMVRRPTDACVSFYHHLSHQVRAERERFERRANHHLRSPSFTHF